jgi:hypothetical protein
MQRKLYWTPRTITILSIKMTLNENMNNNEETPHDKGGRTHGTRSQGPPSSTEADLEHNLAQIRTDKRAVKTIVTVGKLNSIEGKKSENEVSEEVSIRSGRRH